MERRSLRGCSSQADRRTPEEGQYEIQSVPDVKNNGEQKLRIFYSYTLFRTCNEQLAFVKIPSMSIPQVSSTELTRERVNKDAKIVMEVRRQAIVYKRYDAI